LDRWINLLPIPDVSGIDFSAAKICEDHFESKYIFVDIELIKRLASTAIPNFRVDEEEEEIDENSCISLGCDLEVWELFSDNAADLKAEFNCTLLCSHVSKDVVVQVGGIADREEHRAAFLAIRDVIDMMQETIVSPAELTPRQKELLAKLEAIGEEIVTNFEDHPELLVFQLQSSVWSGQGTTTTTLQRTVRFGHAGSADRYLHLHLAELVALFQLYLRQNRSVSRTWLWYRLKHLLGTPCKYSRVLQDFCELTQAELHELGIVVDFRAVMIGGIQLEVEGEIVDYSKVALSLPASALKSIKSRSPMS
jgi:hypothetical protein